MTSPSVILRFSRDKRRHTGVKPFQCQYREKPFSRADVLQLHSRAHTGEMPIVCRQCGIVFSRSGYLKSHLITHPWKKSKCSYCEKCFARKPSLTSHERSHPRKHNCAMKYLRTLTEVEEEIHWWCSWRLYASSDQFVSFEIWCVISDTLSPHWESNPSEIGRIIGPR